MSEWRLVDDAQAARRWDGWLAGFSDRHFKQSWAWGEFKRARGWELLRAGIFSGERPLALAQCAIKRPRGLPAALVWSNGGPAFRAQDDDADNRRALADFLDGLSAESRRRFAGFYLRVNLLTPEDAAAEQVLSRCGFKRALAPLSPGLSAVLELGAPLETLERALDKKWRNQLHAAQKKGARCEFGREPGLRRRYAALHEQMRAIKGLREPPVSVAELDALAEAFGPMLELGVAGLDGQDGAGLLLWRYAGKAYLGYAAANAWGRQHSLSNALYWDAVARLKAAGDASFDTCGLDPKKAPGVTHFKLGLNGRVVQYINEWDFARPSLARLPANGLIALRGAA